MNRSPTFRLTAVLLALGLGLSGGAPALQACCASGGAGLPAHCGTSAPVEHCEAESGMTSTACVAHYFRPDMRPAKAPTVDPSFGGASFGVAHPALALESRSTTSVVSSRRAVRRAVRRHAHVEVWRE